VIDNFRGCVLGIDPGQEKSGYVVVNAEGVILRYGVVENWAVLSEISVIPSDDWVAIEIIESYGQAIGKTTIDTIEWIGRFTQARDGDIYRVSRRNAKKCICGTTKSNDSDVRAALILRYGPTKEKAIGTHKNPGPLYGVTSHAWQALAVALTCLDNMNSLLRTQR